MFPKISQLIKELEAVKAKFGDIKVRARDLNRDLLPLVSVSYLGGRSAIILSVGDWPRGYREAEDSSSEVLDISGALPESVCAYYPNMRDTPA